MKPHVHLAEAKTPDGGKMTLTSHDGSFAIRYNGQELMHSRATASEEQMGQLAVEKLKKGAAARVLVGGLGLGVTLDSILGRVGVAVKVDVVELLEAVIDWNRTHLKELHGHWLEKPQVKVVAGDVVDVIHQARPGTYDALVLDIDNGPVAMVQRGNGRLYHPVGLRAVARCLKDDGRVIFWSAGPDRKFQERLEEAGFEVKVVPAKVHATAKRAAYVLFVGERRRSLGRSPRER